MFAPHSYWIAPECLVSLENDQFTTLSLSKSISCLSLIAIGSLQTTEVVICLRGHAPQWGMRAPFQTRHKRVLQHFRDQWRTQRDFVPVWFCTVNAHLWFQLRLQNILNKKPLLHWWSKFGGLYHQGIITFVADWLRTVDTHLWFQLGLQIESGEIEKYKQL